MRLEYEDEKSMEMWMKVMCKGDIYRKWKWKKVKR
jgi:hypothetical protein